MLETAPRRKIRLLAKDVMSAPVITVRPDTSVKDVAALMLAHRISGLPVVTPEGEVVGIVTEADLLYKESGAPPRDPGFLKGRLPFSRSADWVRKASGLTAADIMTTPVVTVDEGTRLSEIAALMVRRKINRVPVLRDGKLVGIVSRADIMRAFVRPDEELAQAVEDALLHELWVDTSRVRITVKDGVVYLQGEVDRRSEKELAERWVATIDGVLRVESTLTAPPDPPGSRPSRLNDWILS